jgi:hypothetical protein
MRIWEVTLLYLFAFLCGAGAAYAVLALGAERLFSGGAQQQVSLMVIMPLLAGLAMFSLVYGLGAGRMLKWRFWVIWPVALFALVRGGVEVMFRGILTIPQAAVIALVLVFVAGLLCCLQRDAVTGPAKGAA